MADNEKWVTVNGKHMLVSDNGKSTKASSTKKKKKVYHTSKIDEMNNMKANTNRKRK